VAVDAQAILAALRAQPSITGATIVGDGSAIVIDFGARTASRVWALRLAWQPAFRALPQVFVRDMAAGFPLAHVSYGGEICYTTNEGVAVDSSRPVDIAIAAADEAIQTLEAAYARQATGDMDQLLDEWEGYWSSLPDAVLVQTHVPFVGPAREIRAHVLSVRGHRRCVGFTEHGAPRSGYGGRLALAPFEVLPALYLPLESAVPAPSRRRPLSPSAIASWVALASAPNQTTAQRFLRAQRHRVDEAYILLSQPRPGRTMRAAFGIGFHGRPARHPLLEPSPGWKITPLVPQRHERDYLIQRGGAQADLSTHQVAIVGCGAVGSRVAEFMALAGVGRLILVDPDSLSADNLFRHVLPADAIPMGKADARKVSLERRLPGIQVVAEVSAASTWPPTWATESLSGVVLAIGDPYIERQLVRQFHASAPPGLPLVTGWMEPHGLGGHALLTNAGRPGCLECLYRNPDGGSRSAPKIGFAVPGSSAGLNLTGCAGAFTPYSALDATQTAVLVSRMMVTALLGGESLMYTCWWGDGTAYRGMGFQTRPWFDTLDATAAREAAERFSQCPCPVCGGT